MESLPATPRSDIQPDAAASPEKRTHRLSHGQESIRPRKKNATACSVCRARKSKCDNQQPRCSYCQSIGATCDRSGSVVPQRPDVSGQAILDRIDRLEARLVGNRSWLESADARQNGSPEAAPTKVGRNCVLGSGNQSPITVEAVLSWPVLKEEYGPCLDIRDLMASSDTSCDDTSSPRAFGTLAASNLIDFELESCSRLVNNFFRYVHIKNPVLDEDEIRSWVREISLNGVGWDARSCLVLIVCALGAISAPFSAEDSENPVEISKLSADRRAAEAYFNASQKRIGSLITHGGGILAAQCFFFSGVYAMSIFRPYAAWSLFVQALACCQTLKCLSKSDHLVAAPLQDFVNRGAVEWTPDESIYWTCFKTELETRLELSLPAFPSMELSYPDFLPTPPREAIEKEDQAWYFYLAEIALRRLLLQILTQIAPYCQGPAQNNLDALAALVPTFEQQAAQWSQLLPPEVDILQHEPGEDILRFILCGHLYNSYEAIYWPFVSSAINRQGLRNVDFDEFVRRGLQVCVDRVWTNEPGFRYRHHGTWLMMRSCTRSALVLVAAKRSGQVETLLPYRWQHAVHAVIKLLDFWSNECNDSGDRRNILDNAMKAVN